MVPQWFSVFLSAFKWVWVVLQFAGVGEAVKGASLALLLLYGSLYSTTPLQGAKVPLRPCYASLDNWYEITAPTPRGPITLQGDAMRDLFVLRGYRVTWLGVGSEARFMRGVSAGMAWVNGANSEHRGAYTVRSDFYDLHRIEVFWLPDYGRYMLLWVDPNGGNSTALREMGCQFIVDALPYWTVDA